MGPRQPRPRLQIQERLQPGTQSVVNKKRFAPLALVDMPRFDPPKADNVLLGFLIGVLSLVSGFALCMYWLLQPTVLPGAGGSAYGREMSVAVALPSRPNRVEIEQSEVDAALLENESQGLQSVAAPSHKPQADSSSRPVKTAQRKPKPKRAARVQRPHTGPFPQDAWAFAPIRGKSFGGWVR